MATVRALLLLIVSGLVLALSSGPIAAQETVTVPVGDDWFCDSSFAGGICETTITAGDTVAWDFSGATNSHSTTECGASCDNPTGSPLWDSGIVDDGSTFQHTFDQAGTFSYYCQVHGANAMSGRIVVQGAAQQPTPTPPAGGQTPEAAPTGTPAVSGVPETGAGLPDGSSGGWWALALLGVAGAALAGLGTLAYRGARAER